MKCLICRQAQLVVGLTSVNFERGEMRLMITHVPAQVCPSCGEAYVGEQVAVQLLQGADGFHRAGILEGEFGYREFLKKTHFSIFK
jgi:YgiT-type zinc finger domain-containing protein